MNDILRISSISQFHEMLGMSAPEHPLISFINEKDAMTKPHFDDALYNVRFTADMYCVMYKDKISGSIGYGRNSYDFQEGSMIFSSPGQVFTSPSKEELKGKEGWTLLFHPDLLLKSHLADKMDSYSYFSYEANEALHLSKKEQSFVFDLVARIKEEYSQNLDKHSQNLIITNLELLLDYSMRYYDRQFITRSNLNSDFVIHFEKELKSYFNSSIVSEQGLPSVKYFGGKLNMSTNYLSDMLKKETGKSVKEHIDTHIIKKAKKVLLNSNNSVSEIAFSLGFEYPQSFTRMFKKKTGVSPLDYRSLN